MVVGGISPDARQVVFLPHAVGPVDAVLTVATSAGDIRYKVLVGDGSFASAELS